jgi:predicted enzyme related to lactoylglutathione lyase
MPIEWEQDGSKLPPLKQEVPPLMTAEALLAIAEVRLAAGDVPPRILRQFYEHVLGLTFVAGDGEGLRFTHNRRQVILARANSEIGALGLQVKDFGDVLARLSSAAVPYEVLHTDGGMTREAVLRDPAGNIIQLVETRLL